MCPRGTVTSVTPSPRPVDTRHEAKDLRGGGEVDPRTVSVAGGMHAEGCGPPTGCGGWVRHLDNQPRDPSGRVVVAPPVHSGPAHRQDSGGSAQSIDTIAPGTSLGCRWVPAMSGRSAFQTVLIPAAAIRAWPAVMSSTWKIAM